MKDIEQLFAKTSEEIEKVLNSKTVVGEPLKVDGATLIPLVSVGFGFGAGGGNGSKADGGAGIFTGGGGGVKPIALVVVDKKGVRVDAIKGAAASVFDKAIDTLGTVVDKSKKTEQLPSSV